MAKVNLDQDVANKGERKYSGQMLSPIASCKNASLRFSN